MPVTALLIKGISVIFEYGMLLCLLGFVLRIAKCMWKDMLEMKQNEKKQGVGGQQKAALVVVEAKEDSMLGRRFSFTDEITIGRSDDNDIIILDSFVSHHHVVIFLRNNQYIAEDLGSRNHTYLNDCQLEGKTYLQEGDLLRVGFMTLRFER